VEIQLPPVVPTQFPAFGSSTLVTLRVARRIGRRGPVPVVVTNRNEFAVTGRLSGRSTRRLARSRAPRRQFVKLRGKPLVVLAEASKTIRLALPRRLRVLLRRRGRVGLRLTATVSDPAGNTRRVVKKATPRLKGRRRSAQG
jgi:hypothetical protein